MRVLWIDADDNPWTDSNGWRTLEDFGVAVHRLPSVELAQAEVLKKNFDLLLVRGETEGAQTFLVNARKLIAREGRKIVLTSSTWSKDEFRAHSKTEGAAHRYARVPMPPEGFLDMLADLFGCDVEGLADAEAIPDQPAVPSEKAKKRPVASSAGEAGDLEVLRRYLHIKEEQLEISESERQELASENERLQREAHLLQMKLREFEHMHDELSKKVAQMEAEVSEAERQRSEERDELERAKRVSDDRVQGLEAQLAEATEKYENMRVRVRKDIRKIRDNERDLEARLELARKDSATLLQARDEKVLELQRKVDALEFDLDQVQDSRVQAQIEAERYLARLSRVSRALQIAVSMVEDEQAGESELEELEPLVGGAAAAEELQAVVNTTQSEPAGARPGDGSGSGGEESGGQGAAGEGGGEAPSAAGGEGGEGGVEDLSPEFAALANDGEPTQMNIVADLSKMGEEPESNSG
jgi:hypothetical protein